MCILCNLLIHGQSAKSRMFICDSQLRELKLVFLEKKNEKFVLRMRERDRELVQKFPPRSTTKPEIVKFFLNLYIVICSV